MFRYVYMVSKKRKRQVILPELKIFLVAFSTTDVAEMMI